jgi:hypothetical protein
MLIESLSDPIAANCYLTAVREDYPQGFHKAEHNVREARRLAGIPEPDAEKSEAPQEKQ